ncbi:MAG: glucose-1-phosphate thymidylyltransferase [Spirochaetia bacterium]|nr:glucose-1-phosphate thymidylyltransferase [Spirochaetia bacterium]
MDNQLSDCFEKSLNPVFTLRPSFAFENGIFSPLERLLKMKPAQIEILTHSNENIRPANFYQNFLNLKHILIKIKITNYTSLVSETPDTLLSNFNDHLLNDLKFLKRDDYLNKNNFLLDGEKSDVWIHNDASISPMTAVNTQKGPVIIDSKARVSAFSILNGPLYIGSESVLDKVMISNSRAGRQCRLGGEISDSLIGNYTNKHHEGFLGHSIVGDWVNLGALTTTSDLKNNYGEINLEYGNDIFHTNRIKFGSIIGDFVKTGIGTMLNTGTIIDIGTLLYQGFKPQKYYPRFYWGGETPLKYQLNRFLGDIEKIMARRNCQPDEFLKSQIQFIYNK